MLFQNTFVKLYLLFFVTFLPSTILAEIKFSKQLMMDMSRTYGYHVGQNHTLNLIEQKYPSLKNEVFLAKNEFKLVFGSSYSAATSSRTLEYLYNVDDVENMDLGF